MPTQASNGVITESTGGTSCSTDSLQARWELAKAGTCPVCSGKQK